MRKKETRIRRQRKWESKLTCIFLLWVVGSKLTMLTQLGSHMTVWASISLCMISITQLVPSILFSLINAVARLLVFANTLCPNWRLWCLVDLVDVVHRSCRVHVYNQHVRTAGSPNCQYVNYWYMNFRYILETFYTIFILSILWVGH